MLVPPHLGTLSSVCKSVVFVVMRELSLFTNCCQCKQTNVGAGIGSMTRLLKWPTVNLFLVVNTTCDNIYKHKTYISWFLCLNHGIYHPKIPRNGVFVLKVSWPLYASGLKRWWLVMLSLRTRATWGRMCDFLVKKVNFDIYFNCE